MLLHPTGMILYGGFLTAFGRMLGWCRRRSTSSAALSCREKRSIPQGVIAVGRRPLYPSGMILYGGFLTAFGMKDTRVVQTAKHFLSRTVMQREAKHPLGVIAVGRSVCASYRHDLVWGDSSLRSDGC